MTESYLHPDALEIVNRVATKHPAARDWIPVIPKPADLISEPDAWSSRAPELDQAHRHLLECHRDETAHILRARFRSAVEADPVGRLLFTSFLVKQDRPSPPAKSTAARRQDLEASLDRSDAQPSRRRPPNLQQLALASFKTEKSDASRINMAVSCICADSSKDALTILNRMMGRTSLEMTPYIWSIKAVAHSKLDENQLALDAAAETARLRPTWVSARTSALANALILGFRKQAFEHAEALDDLVGTDCPVADQSTLPALGQAFDQRPPSQATILAARKVADHFHGTSRAIANAILETR